MNHHRAVKATQGSQVFSTFTDAETGIKASVAIQVKVDPDTTEQWSAVTVEEVIREAISDNLDLIRKGRGK